MQAKPAPQCSYCSGLHGLSPPAPAPTPGGALAAQALLPRRAPLAGCAMSGALFGLFSMATLFNGRKAWHWHRCFELAALAPFVALQLTAAHGGLAQHCALQGVKLPGSWAPLLGGLAGAAAAAGLLLLARVVAAGMRQQRQQAGSGSSGQQSGGGGSGDSGGGGDGGGAQEPVALLAKAAGLLLRRLVLP